MKRWGVFEWASAAFVTLAVVSFVCAYVWGSGLPKIPDSTKLVDLTWGQISPYLFFAFFLHLFYGGWK